MKLTFDESKPAHELDKRQTIPGWSLRFCCPKCHKDSVVDYGRQHMSYPIPNQFCQLTLYCECGHEWSGGKIRVDLGLTIVDVDGYVVPVERSGG